ncbi:hypothetical protein POM88_012830 [Heracleum sosnowskyi]|uniref:ATP-dependent DNA ligase family profile domain-containing protein n=1 Tax=Heracleum sosnowskyi TaxID=360622 RepID=A0AAD8IX81_9APIA|nr:hypothetical protein POM88_012830 [Heracleum sosnowskyi]
MVQARLREATFLEKHVLIKNLRDALESLRGRVVGINKDDVEEAISMLVQCYTQVSILYKLVFLLEMPDGQVEALAVHLTQREGELIQEKTEVKKLANFMKQVKRDYVESLNDSLDLVPIGAWHGNGRKAGWYSPFLMACYNPDLEEFQSVCHVMSGISDSFYTKLQEAPALGSFNPEKGELVLAQFKGDNEILPNLPHSCSEKTLP